MVRTSKYRSWRTAWGGWSAGTTWNPGGGEHGTIYQTYGLRRVLATLLGKPGYLAGVPAHIEVSVRDKVVEPRDVVHVMIGFGENVRDFSGVLTIDRAQIDLATGMAVAFDPPREVYPVAYEGLGMESMSLLVKRSRSAGTLPRGLPR